MMIRSVILVFIWSLTFIVPNFGQNIEDRFKNGNEWLKKGNNEAALTDYQAVEDSRQASFGLYKNMALAHANLKQDAFAILYFEKCLKLQPFDKMVLNDLKVIKQRNPELSEGIPDFVLVKTFKNIAGLFSPMIWTVLSFIFLLWFGVVMVKSWPDRLLNKRFYLKFGVFLILFMITTSFAYHRNAQIYGTNAFIIVEKNASLMIGPDENSPKKFKITEGSKVVKLDEIGSWMLVRTIESDQGWIQMSHCKVI